MRPHALGRCDLTPQRSNQALLKDPEIRKGIRKWWDTFHVEEPKDAMSIHDYAHMHFLLDISMHEMGFNLPDDQLLADVLEDWAEDCMGAPTIRGGVVLCCVVLCWSHLTTDLP